MDIFKIYPIGRIIIKYLTYAQLQSLINYEGQYQTFAMNLEQRRIQYVLDKYGYNWVTESLLGDLHEIGYFLNDYKYWSFEDVIFEECPILQMSFITKINPDNTYMKVQFSISNAVNYMSLRYHKREGEGYENNNLLLHRLYGPAEVVIRNGQKTEKWKVNDIPMRDGDNPYYVLYDIDNGVESVLVEKYGNRPNDKPSYIRWYSNGNIEWKQWERTYTTDKPTIISYYLNGQIKSKVFGTAPHFTQIGYDIFGNEIYRCNGLDLKWNF